MYDLCPKCGYARRAQDKVPADQCPGCGIWFSRWEQRERYKRELRQLTDNRTSLQRTLDCLQLTDGGTPPVRRPFFWGRLAVYFLLFIWSWKFAGYDYRDGSFGESFMHLPLLALHEGGHVFFAPMGEFMHILGGSLMQILVPLSCGAVFLFRRNDPLAASFCLWWTGISFIDLAPYIYDALDPKMILTTGRTGADGAHDWISILSSFGMLQKAHTIGKLTHTFGILILILAHSWGAILLLRQFQLPVSDGLSATGTDDF